MKICALCGRRFEPSFALVAYCSAKCRRVRRLEYYRDYMRARRATESGRRAHREWMARKRLDDDYRERENARQRERNRRARR